MSFLAPLAFIGALLAAPIILLYMLRLRRREVTVSSTYLWQQVLRDQEANTPWQRLRRNLLMILQLIILALLVLALARPFITVPAISSRQTVLLLDASASMNATDMPNNRSRFRASQDEALAIINGMSPADRMAVIRVGASAEVLLSYSDDQTALRAAVQAARPGQGMADWETALTLAAAGGGGDDFTMILLSDGGIDPGISLPQTLPSPIYRPIGQSSHNLALTALATRAQPGQDLQLFARAENFGPEAANASVVIKLDGRLWQSSSGTLPAGEGLSLSFTLDQAFSTIEAALIPDDPQQDLLALDNSAWASAPAAGVRSALLVSDDDNIFIEQILRSLPGLDAVRADAARMTLPAEAFDLYIFDGWLPDVLPDGDMLIINPPRSSTLFTLGPVTDSPGQPRITNPDHPLTAFLSVDNVNLRALRPVTSADWADTLIAAERGALLLAGSDGNRQIALLPFDLADSDLPLQIAWPVLMANAVDWYSPPSLSSQSAIGVDEPLSIRPPAGAAELTVTDPQGRATRLDINPDQVLFTGTDQAGLYRITAQAADGQTLSEQTVAANLFSPQESRITPVEPDALQLGGQSLGGDGIEQEGLREFWPLLALLALLVLLIEWVVYHRRLQLPTVLHPLKRRLS